jgi:hypothetical protein
VPTLRAKSPRFVPRASNDAGSGAICLSFRSPHLDVTGQTISDRSDSHFVQRLSSTLSRHTCASKAATQIESQLNKRRAAARVRVNHCYLTANVSRAPAGSSPSSERRRGGEHRRGRSMPTRGAALPYAHTVQPVVVAFLDAQLADKRRPVYGLRIGLSPRDTATSAFGLYDRPEGAGVVVCTILHGR